MENAQSPFMGNYPDPDGLPAQTVEAGFITTDSPNEEVALHTLMQTGFLWEEATQLLHLREHLHENHEMHQRMSEDHRMHFVRWLYENGEVSET